MFGVEAHDNLAVHHVPDFSEVTPYERDYADFEARFKDHDIVPHHEVDHDDHGIQGKVQKDSDPMHHSTPTYEELLWAF
jgi:hypothetical protein